VIPPPDVLAEMKAQPGDVWLAKGDDDAKSAAPLSHAREDELALSFGTMRPPSAHSPNQIDGEPPLALAAELAGWFRARLG
jgi:hypothetical protein